MSRLTLLHYGGKGHYMKCSERLACNGNCGDCDSLDEIVEKLAEYEDKEEQKPQTNADRIRAMSDKELAHWINLNADEDFAYEHCCSAEWRKTPCNNKCVACLAEWLKQPVKDGEDDG